MRRALAALLLLSAAACAYVLPASWRSYRADPDDAPPAITRALDERSLAIANWDQAKHQIVTEWTFTRTSIDAMRERYVISWERDDDEGALTIYCRHEAQDRELVDGAAGWTSTYHSSDKEAAMLDAITEALQDAKKPMPE
ncbi:MAG: hypothetical protein RMA76_29590 [Deltaproteobacteria bacterium]|jgi:uncharacterized lipoprotein